MHARDLDALVAEKVMGWRRVPLSFNPEQEVVLPPDVPDVGAHHSADRVHWWGRDLRELVPAYSTDIAAAWQLVEKMHADGFTVDVLWEKDDGPGVAFTKPPARRVQGVSVFLHRSGITSQFAEDREVSFVWAGNLPEAICRAALAAVAERGHL